MDPFLGSAGKPWFLPSNMGIDMGIEWGYDGNRMGT
jgi:hypothetical protein